MNPWLGKAIILASSIVMVLIRAPYGQRSCGVKVIRSGRGTLEVVQSLRSRTIRFAPCRSRWALSASPWGCGSSRGHTRILARTGQSRLRCGKSTSL